MPATSSQPSLTVQGIHAFMERFKRHYQNTAALRTQEVRAFMERFKRHYQNTAALRKQRFAQRFGVLSAGLKPLLRLRAQEEREKAPSFELFSTLIASQQQENTHSAWLASLLEPMDENGHGQGNLFLEGFIGMLNQQLEAQRAEQPAPTTKKLSLPQAIQPPEKGWATETGWESVTDWNIRREGPTEEGKLVDIVITSSQASLAIALENKIWAWEQENQLKNYGDWLAQSGYRQKILVFLTPDGYEAETASGHAYLRLSYTTHIYQWLSTTLPRVQAPMVKAALEQYLRWIKKAFAA